MKVFTFSFSTTSIPGPDKHGMMPLVKMIFAPIARLILIGLLVVGCQSKPTSFKSFETSRWKAEEKECTGYRNSVIQGLEGEFDQFIGMNETEIIEYLGNPDKTLLYTRGQKFFSYNLDCKDTAGESKQLRIRFSALDYVNEVLVLD